MNVHTSPERDLIRSYRDLVVWQRAIEGCVAIYRLTEEFPREETYGLSVQLRRASVSTASNIAEGWGRASGGEYRQFLGMARGSNFETQTQLVIAGELGYGSKERLLTAEALSIAVGKMLVAMMQKLQANAKS
jgi:four helix bundle protein